MEAGFPAFRNRKFSRRADYMPLENDSDADSSRRSTPHVQRPCDRPRATNVTLCDKCWKRQSRSRATKRCLDCKQYLCKSCAKCDEVVRPWWIPKWILSCWRFLFTDVYTPHSIQDLQSYGANDQHWAHTQEASRVHGIPRVTRSSLRSKGSNMTEDSVSSRRYDGSRSVCSDSDRYRRGSISRSPKHVPREHRPLKQTRSYEGKPRRSLERRVQKSSSPGPLVHNYRHDDIERLRRYKDNWERAFDADSHDYMKQMAFHNKLIGKDVMIELTNKDAKVVVNEELEKAKKRKKEKADPKKKRKVKLKSDTPVTEQVFEEVPIWFKKPRKNSAPNTAGESNNDKGLFKRSGSSNNVKTGMNHNFQDERPYEFGSYSNGRQHNGSDNSYSKAMRVDYIVEEPADSCPICLEDLPGLEARSLSCSHVFHTKCLLHLLSTSEVDFGIKCAVCAKITFIKNYYTSKENWLKELPLSSNV